MQYLFFSWEYIPIATVLPISCTKYCMDWLSISAFIGPLCLFVFECQCQHGPMFVTTSASSRVREALRQCLPDQLKDATLSMYLKDENTKKWLLKLMHVFMYAYETVIRYSKSP